MEIKQDNLKFGEALEHLKQGRKIKVPEWEGYWYKKNGEIWVHLEDGTEVNTPWFQRYIFREDWQVVVI